jgi:hypothetical protein
MGIGKWLLGGVVIGGGLWAWSNSASAATLSPSRTPLPDPVPAPGSIDGMVFPPEVVTITKAPAKAKPKAKPKAAAGPVQVPASVGPQDIDPAQARERLAQAWPLIEKGLGTREQIEMALMYAQATQDNRASQLSAMLAKMV